MKAACLLVLVGTVLAADPVAFSHKRHTQLKLACTYCHATAVAGERASYPTASVCMTCHQQIGKDKRDIKSLTALPKETSIEPAHSVYMLADFAFFSHARHYAAKITCEKCHGQVYQMDVVEQVLPMTMKACMNCHRETQAATACSKCHELGQ